MATLVRAHREPIAVRHRISSSGMGQGSFQERLVAGGMIQDISGVYLEMKKILEQLLPAVEQLNGAYKGFQSSLSRLALNQFMKSGGPFSITAPISAVFAVTQAVLASRKQGIDFRKSTEAITAVADSLKHTDMSLQAFQRITLGDLVDIGVISESQARDMAGRAGYDANLFWDKLNLEPLAKGWASRSGSTVPAGWIDARWEGYVTVYEKIRTALEASAKLMKVEIVLEDESLTRSLKKRLLEGMKKAHDDVRANRKPKGWASAAFNKAIDFALKAGPYLIFGIAGIAFTQFMGPIFQMDIGLPRVTFAAVQLVEASAKIAAAGVTTYAATFNKARVAEGKPEGEAKKEGTAAMDEAVARVGKEEYNRAYDEIEAYKNFSKEIQARFQAFLEGLWDIGKWILLGAVALVVGGVIVTRAVTPTPTIRIERG